MKTLPKWAQEYINTLERERATAIRELREWTDTQTKSPFFIDELVSDGESQGPSFYVRYIQTRRVVCEHNGVQVTVHIREDDVEVTLGRANCYSCDDIALICESRNRSSVKTKEQMR